SDPRLYKQKKPEMRPFCSCRQRPASLYNVLIVVGFTIIAIVFGAEGRTRTSHLILCLNVIKFKRQFSVPTNIPTVPFSDYRTA
ncbi:hypothetical protein, partial [Escherichia coli]|uniref:hypothetical protein n=1 Tax=Escherichia coli TaxID=562 RepID=UPI001BDC84B6